MSVCVGGDCTAVVRYVVSRRRRHGDEVGKVSICQVGPISGERRFSPCAVCCHQRPFASPLTDSSLPSDVPLEHVCSSLAHVTLSSRQSQHLCLFERSFINLSDVNMPQWYEYVIGCALAKIFIFGFLYL
jgi:hypothetical protein